MARRAGTVVAAVLALLLGALVLWPDGERVRRLVLDVYLFFLHRGVPPSVTPEHYAAVLNVLAFVPLGWLGVALGRRPRTVVLVLAVSSAVIEALQLLPILHRDASLLDVACNTTGAAAGALAASAFVGRSRRRVQDPGGDEAVDEPLDVRRDDLR